MSANRPGADEPLPILAESGFVNDTAALLQIEQRFA
jgi:hypothetical protein